MLYVLAPPFRAGRLTKNPSNSEIRSIRGGLLSPLDLIQFELLIIYPRVYAPVV